MEGKRSKKVPAIKTISLITLYKIGNRTVISLFLPCGKITSREFTHSSVIGDAFTAFSLSGAARIGAVTV
jgi:hypothetical protein